MSTGTSSYTSASSTKPNGQNGQPSPATAAPPAEKRCAYRTPQGTPCRAAHRKDSRFCIFHDHKFQEERSARRVQKKLLNLRLRADSAEGVQSLLIRTAERLLKNEITQQAANSIGFLAQGMMANLDRVSRGRSVVNHEEDSTNDLARIVVSAKLDEIEDEIKKAGSQASPIRVAQTTLDELRASLANDK